MRYIVINLASQPTIEAPFLVIDTLDQSSTQVVAYCVVRARADAIAALLNETP